MLAQTAAGGRTRASVPPANWESVLVSFDFCVLHSFYALCFQSCDGTACFSGHTSLSFSGNSYIKYRVTDGDRDGEMKLSLRIRTLQSRGIIMYMRSDPCTVLKVLFCAFTYT